MLVKNDSQDKIIDYFFPPVIGGNSGISPSVYTALRESKIVTVNQLRNTPDKELLAIKGVGPSAIIKIRDFANGYSGDDTIDRVDAVDR